MYIYVRGGSVTWLAHFRFIGLYRFDQDCANVLLVGAPRTINAALIQSQNLQYQFASLVNWMSIVSAELSITDHAYRAETA